MRFIGHIDLSDLVSIDKLVSSLTVSPTEVDKENETHKILSASKLRTLRKCLHLCWKSSHRSGIQQIWNSYKRNSW